MSPKALTLIEELTRAVGSVGSLILHSLAFLTAFLLGAFGLAEWDSILLILTTVVSLEAIYLAIFIQMSVNLNTASLREVEVDVDEIQEVDARDALHDAKHHQELQSISERLQRLLEDVNNMNK